MASVLKLMGLDLAVPDHTTLSRRASKPRAPNKRQFSHVPDKGPVHVLIDSSGLQIYGAGQWLEDNTVPDPVANGVNCIWRWRPTAAGSSHRS